MPDSIGEVMKHKMTGIAALLLCLLCLSSASNHRDCFQFVSENDNIKHYRHQLNDSIAINIYEKTNQLDSFLVEYNDKKQRFGYSSKGWSNLDSGVFMMQNFTDSTKAKFYCLIVAIPLVGQQKSFDLFYANQFIARSTGKCVPHCYFIMDAKDAGKSLYSILVKNKIKSYKLPLGL